MPVDEYRRANRANWDARVELHFPSDEYGVAKYVADPNHLSGVVEFDRHKLGDVSGKRLLHLQCHIGTDTVSWARLGATVTGTDISTKSIEAARQLSRDAKTPVRFVVSELYDTPQALDEKFDIVYTGVGAICWLPDIVEWAKVVASFLDPGGVFYMREGHPLMWSLDFELTDKLEIGYPYFETAEPVEEYEDETYAGEGKVSSPVTYGWNHGIGETIDALIRAGFRIDQVEEYDECEWQALDSMVLGDNGRWHLPERRELVPMMWSVLATRI